MEARLKLWKSAGVWWWELKTHNDSMMTPDRLVDIGTGDTWDSAYGDAELAWMHFMQSFRSAA